MDKKRYYVYAYLRLDTNSYFYIGKGTGNRWLSMNQRNSHFLNIVKNVEICVEIICDNLSNNEAYNKERDLIEDLVFNEGYSIEINGIERNNHMHLVNRTWGGEGAASMTYSHTRESKEKIRKAHLGKKLSKETREKLRQANLGKNNPNYGKQCSEERKRKISVANKGRIFSDEWRKNLSISHKGNVSHRRKPVYCIELDITFESGDKAIQIMKSRYSISCPKIKEVCNGKRKTSGKLPDGTRLHWRWAESTPATTE